MAATWTIIRDEDGTFSVGKTGKVIRRMVIDSATVHLDLAIPRAKDVGIFLYTPCTHSNHRSGRLRNCPSCGVAWGTQEGFVPIAGWRLLNGSCLPKNGRIVATLRVQLSMRTATLHIGREWLSIEVGPDNTLEIKQHISKTVAVCGHDEDETDPVTL